jgi:hypothetical protein
MAKKHYKAPLHQTGTIITTKTHFGSTGDMLIDHYKYKYIKDNGPVILNDNMGAVVCKDDKGFYMTFKNHIDSGLADPNRYSNPYMRLNIVEIEENTSSS